MTKRDLLNHNFIFVFFYGHVLKVLNLLQTKKFYLKRQVYSFPLTIKNLNLFKNHKITRQPKNFISPSINTPLRNFFSKTYSNNTFFFLFKNYNSSKKHSYLTLYTFSTFINLFFISFYKVFKQTLGDGFLYLRGLFFIFFIDACLTDDEPIWEPVE